MKTILILACAITLLATSGCVVVAGRHDGVVAPVVPVPVPAPVPVPQ
jgi:hypothetical protein